MSTNNVGDVTIAVNAAGAGETERELSRVEERLESSGETMSDTADEMGGLQSRMAGLGQTIITGLAVLSAGLLSQIPVIGESFQALASVLQAAAFQADKVLRPALQPLNTALFNLSGAIATAEGPMGAFIGVLTSVIAIVTPLLAGFLALGGSISTLTGIATGLASTLAGPVIAAVTAIAGVLGLPVLAVGALIAAIVALVAIIATDFMGIRTMAINALLDIGESLGDLAGDIAGFAVDAINTLAGWASDAADAAVDFVTNLATTIANRATDVLDAVDAIVTDVTDAITGLVDDAVAWGMRLIQNLVDGIVNAAAGVGDLFGDLASGDFAAVGQAVLDVTGGGGGAGSGGGGNPRRDRTGVFGGTREQLAVFISGRQADQGVARYRDDNTLRRGRPQ